MIIVKLQNRGINGDGRIPMNLVSGYRTYPNNHNPELETETGIQALTCRPHFYLLVVFMRKRKHLLSMTSSFYSCSFFLIGS